MCKLQYFLYICKNKMLMSKNYILKFDNRINNSSFKRAVLCISVDYAERGNDDEKQNAMLRFEESAKKFFDEYRCKTDGQNCAKYVLKRPSKLLDGDDDAACVFFPVLNMGIDSTCEVVDTVLKYMSFNGIEPRFDDYIRINKELKSKFEEK